MTAPKQIVRQRDFSGGQMVASAKRRDDEAAVRAACRDLGNGIIMASGAVEQRPGRAALFQDGRTDQIRMDPDYSCRFCFGAGTLTIRNSSGTVVARAWGYDWATATVDQIVWAQIDRDVVMTFPGQIPKIARWDGGTEWTFLDWAARETSGGQKRVPFIRISPKGITLLPSARSGAINITFSDDVLVAGHVGTRMRFVNRQIEIASVTGPTTGTATVKEPLPGSQVLTFATDPREHFALAEIVKGDVHNSTGYITALDATTMTVQLLTINSVQFFGGIYAFGSGETVTGPGGSLQTSSVATIGDPVAVEIWDEEAFNAHQGWPRSCNVDQNRLIFCDFPAVPEGIGWSTVLTPDDFYPGTLPTEAMFETAPRKSRVYHIVGGADEFAITDRGIYYIPISEANPLRPGSVAFRRVPGASGSAVRPVETAQGVVYVNNGLNRLLGIVSTGQTAMPWVIRPVSDLHADLFSGITCLAVEEGDGNPPNELVYAVNDDGTVAVGRYQPGKEWVGWTPWSGAGDVTWVSALGATVLFTVDYAAGSLVERVDSAQWLDAAVDYDAIPAPLITGAQADVLLSDDQGTAIGDMTASGGLAAAFDGTTSQVAAASASRAAATTGAVGKTFGQPFRIAKAQVWPSSNSGFTDQANVTITLRAKAGAAPSSYATEGTQLATTGSIVDTALMQTLTSSDEATEWDHAWVLLTIAAGITYVAELRLYSPGLNHGSGELWFLAGDTLKVMDGRRYIGDRAIDAAGEVTLLAGDAFTDETFGHGFTRTIEPFLAHVQGGTSVGQTMKARGISDGAIAVQNSTGFRVEVMQPDATWATVLDWPPYRGSESQDAEPPLREEVVTFRPQGSDHDPRIRVVKDTPGPLRVLEIGVEIGA